MSSWYRPARKSRRERLHNRRIRGRWRGPASHDETVALVEALRVDEGRGRIHTAMPADPEHIAAETGITCHQARAGVMAAVVLDRTSVYGDVSIAPLGRAAKPAQRAMLRRAGLVP